MEIEETKTINSLIRRNLDCAIGLREAAENVEDAAATQVLNRASYEHMDNAAQLQGALLELGEKPVVQGRYAGRLKSAWIDLWSSVQSDHPQTVVRMACDATERVAQAYRSVLDDRKVSSPFLSALLVHQFSACERNVDRLDIGMRH